MSMILHLNRFRSPLERVERTFQPEEFRSEGDDFRVVSPVDFAADVHKDGRKFRLVGSVAGTLETPCSRCLEPYTFPVKASFDLLFLPHADAPVEGETEVNDDDVGVSFYRDDEINLGEVMREQFYLAMPMKPLCRADCQGLCPVCGNNRNLAPCDCKSDWIDPRLEALRNLRGQ
jgi:uncharacterized protein